MSSIFIVNDFLGSPMTFQSNNLFTIHFFLIMKFPSPKSTSSTLARNNRRKQVLLSGGKRKRSEENPETDLKKPKQLEAPAVPPTKVNIN